MKVPDLYPRFMRLSAAALGVDVATYWAIWQDGYAACDEDLAALWAEAVRRVRVVNGLPVESRPRKRVA